MDTFNLYIGMLIFIYFTWILTQNTSSTTIVIMQTDIPALESPAGFRYHGHWNALVKVNHLFD